jgi:hypothetical protein
VSNDTAHVFESEILNKLDLQLGTIVYFLPNPSESSRCWLEMVLVETALRNRDRFSLLWPHLSGHYGRTLGRMDQSCAASSAGSLADVIKFDYITERYGIRSRPLVMAEIFN